MDQISILSIFLVSLPEAIIVCILGILSIGKFGFLKERRNFYLILVYAIISCTFSYFVRRNVSNEIESLLISMFINCLLYVFIIRFKFYESILSTLFGFIVFLITELALILTISSLTGIKLDTVYLDELTRILLPIPERIVQITLIIASIKYRFKFLDLECATIKRREFIFQMIIYIIAIITLIFLTYIMAKVLLSNSTNDFLIPSNSLLLRLNLYLSLFVTVILTLAIRSTHEFYKNKNTLKNNELLQSLEYISSLLDENNTKEAKDTVDTLKAYVSKQ